MDEKPGSGEDGARLETFLVTLPSAWPSKLRKAVIDFALLCAGIVAITMLPIRIERDDGFWFVLFALGGVAGVVTFVVVAQQLARRSPITFGQAAANVLRTGLRRLGLPLVGLVFFVVWTAIYISLWLVRPDGAFAGLAAAPRVADFFYYAVSAALLATPQDIVATSRGARAATLIEMLTGFAVLATYLASFVNWRDARAGGGEARARDTPSD
ncbi:MAG: hypothetical protein FJW96_16160 [Actinobacteria bacterium]|nr:hypothetical protein [Actinomycetota bacterium]